jgi:hypothetical protein
MPPQQSYGNVRRPALLDPIQSPEHRSVMVTIPIYKVHMPGQTATYYPVDAYFHRDFLMFPKVGDMGGNAHELFLTDHVSIGKVQAIFSEAVRETGEDLDDFNKVILERVRVPSADVWADPTRPRRVCAYHRSKKFARELLEKVLRSEYGYPQNETFTYSKTTDQPEGEIFMASFYKDDGHFAPPSPIE